MTRLVAYLTDHVEKADIAVDSENGGLDTGNITITVVAERDGWIFCSGSRIS